MDQSDIWIPKCTEGGGGAHWFRTSSSILPIFLVALYNTTFVVLTYRTDVNAILCYQGNPTSKIPNHLFKCCLFIVCHLLEDLVEGGLWHGAGSDEHSLHFYFYFFIFFL